MPARDEMPSTLRRSPEEARRTWAKAHDAAVETYGEGERAHRTAYATLKRTFEKVGDHWEPKPSRGPSDRQAANPRAGRGEDHPTAEGVDANAPRRRLYERARQLDIPGRSSMTKEELVEALKKENRSRTRRAR
ncbi:ChaB family protein [Thermobifida cellulosilytica]|uniref:Cation transport regulator ChaB n=1 Tax=Thermobifida cellulosilytica TB100 TaxID=665004 RepID=A0A147KJU4_THECS|nr:ChaB family protein [Thermobifida cellulosilytica]KUP97557.1 cation transport regulator ChaB [Thermobifida cellulosilytica TB100]